MSHRVHEFFARRNWTPAPFQEEVWAAMARGESGLLHSETGSGKTLAVWLGYLSIANDAPGLKVLWITPLRALAGDTLQALIEPLEDVGLAHWRVESRTGDTSSNARSRQLKAAPDALVSTPESLNLLLANGDGERLLQSVDLVVIDEWHELLGSKRGVQIELALARLRKLRPTLMIWGISATLGNTTEAAEVLIPIARAQIVRGESEKEIVVDTLLPDSMERFPWSGHIGVKMVPKVAQELETVESALIFTNTRAQAEIWHSQLLTLRPDWAQQVGLHHGSLELSERYGVEQGLKSGRLRAVVATSSLDLGVDFSPVDRVFQVGSPKGIARLLQRAGRSGHRPGATSRITCVPTHGLELIDFHAAQHAIQRQHIEGRTPILAPLDVLAQHLVTLAVGGGFHADEVFDEVRTTHAYRDLSREDFDWTLDFVTIGGRALSAYPDFRRVVEHRGLWMVPDKKTAQRHRMNIGTIVSDASMNVQYLKGGRIGNVEESFVSRLKKGDVFVFGGKALEFVTVKDLTCYVRAAKTKSSVIPRWSGGRLPLSTELSQSIRQTLSSARDGDLGSPELKMALPMLEIQQKWSAIPRADEFLIEYVTTREGFHAFIYPFEGRLVHEGLGALIAYRLSRRSPQTISVACNDYGIELFTASEFDFAASMDRELFTTDRLTDDILASINSSEMAKRQFREIARVSGLILQSMPGLQKSSRQIQASAGLIYDVLDRYDPEHLLLKQSIREVLDRSLEQTRLVNCLNRLSDCNWLIKCPPRPTPFAFPILVDRLKETISTETVEARIQRILQSMEREAS